VLDGRCSFGVVGTLPIAPDSMTLERLQGVAMIMVAAREHPLAMLNGVVPNAELANHVQLVLTDRSELTAGREFGVMSPFSWRLGDLLAKPKRTGLGGHAAACRQAGSSRRSTRQAFDRRFAGGGHDVADVGWLYHRQSARPGRSLAHRAPKTM
jgi:hypothetical protein